MVQISFSGEKSDGAELIITFVKENPGLKEWQWQEPRIL
jgi:hypothetical protein